ncbi:hypothetical protein RFI36_14410 [Acinetobacter gerneri]|nr:hypothetical protein [Acinetobacter gerneri]MDQ9010842.1 hypothetical protein [Acinetobacter gerneri]MDQ9014978.1 hypothetical protein [Acinetobacter gerneri]MDQ9026149.1 hypothetical protein [Acinetobacter gerneri]MDQ9053430.1 hypothetical protein [Acinetobacter gerneri]MDQ9061049.1 hypothetical protein [Acinetobacter gerneri]
MKTKWLYKMNFLKIIYLGFFLILGGCTKMFEEEQNLYFNFRVEENTKLPNLNVNLYTYDSESGSKWYGLVKKQTVIKKGQYLEQELKSINSDWHALYIYNGDSSKFMYDDHIFRGAIYHLTYIFKIDGLLTQSRITRSEHGGDDEFFMKYKELEDAEQKGFNYYNPIDARYEINDIQPDNLNTLKKMTFDELKNVDKILAKDIFKLNQLTLEQKKALAEIHQHKQFKIPVD